MIGSRLTCPVDDAEIALDARRIDFTGEAQVAVDPDVPHLVVDDFEVVAFIAIDTPPTCRS